jgi:hypothetical protein
VRIFGTLQGSWVCLAILTLGPFFYLSATNRNRQAINRRFIDVQAASRAEYYEAIANVRQTAPSVSIHCVSLVFRRDLTH